MERKFSHNQSADNSCEFSVLVVYRSLSSSYAVEILTRPLAFLLLINKSRRKNIPHHISRKLPFLFSSKNLTLFVLLSPFQILSAIDIQTMEKRVRFRSPTPTVNPPPKKTQGKQELSSSSSSSSSTITIPATSHCPSYSSASLSELSKLPTFRSDRAGFYTQFAHLPCSLIANSSAAPPTILALKQHIQALCQLLYKLEPATTADEPSQSGEWRLPSPTFDFLNDLQIPYESDDPAENKPVTSLANQNPSAAKYYASASKFRHPTSDPAQTCPLDLDPASRTIPHTRAHANKLLTYLDRRHAATGGILSMTPSPAIAHTFLSQWLLYTSRLVVRLAELEREVINLREVLGNESLVAGVRAHASLNQNGESSAREMLFPQDRYVLAGLSDALWLRITEALNISAEEAINRETNNDVGTVRGSGPFETTSAGTDSDLETDQEQARYGDIVSWVETTARLYRVRGHETVFVIPAWNMHQGARAVREVERGPLVTSVPHVRRSDADTADEWHTAGVNVRETRLAREIASLKRSLAEARDERDNEKRMRLGAKMYDKGAEALSGGKQKKKDDDPSKYSNLDWSSGSPSAYSSPYSSSSSSSTASADHDERAKGKEKSPGKHVSWARQTEKTSETSRSISAGKERERLS